MPSALLPHVRLAEEPPQPPLALWVSSPLDPAFESSPVRLWMDAFVDAAETVEGFVWSEVLHACDLVPFSHEEPLPPRRDRVDVAWEGRISVALVASVEEGIVPHFSKSVPSAWRVDFLRTLARVALHFRERQRSTGIGPKSPCAGRIWWERVKDAHELAGEPGEPVLPLSAHARRRVA